MEYDLVIFTRGTEEADRGTLDARPRSRGHTRMHTLCQAERRQCGSSPSRCLRQSCEPPIAESAATGDSRASSRAGSRLACRETEVHMTGNSGRSRDEEGHVRLQQGFDSPVRLHLLDCAHVVRAVRDQLEGATHLLHVLRVQIIWSRSSASPGPGCISAASVLQRIGCRVPFTLIGCYPVGLL